MLEVEIGRTTCRKTTHLHLDNCDFQTNPALKQVRQKSLSPEAWPFLPPFTDNTLPNPILKIISPSAPSLHMNTGQQSRDSSQGHKVTTVTSHPSRDQQLLTSSWGHSGEEWSEFGMERLQQEKFSNKIK